MSKPRVSIIIPAYNEEKYIEHTLRSVKDADATGLDIELIVLDGSSTDKTPDVARKAGATVYTESHKGIGYARQMGVQHAKGDIILFTDADTTVPKDWIQRHVTTLLQPDVVFTYGTFRVTDGHFPYYQYINYIQPWQLWLLHHLLGKPVAAGQNLAFWKEKAMSIGGFDKNIRVMEDTDLAIRMRKVGKVVFLPDLVVLSSGRRSMEGWGFFLRMAGVTVQYFLMGRRSLGGFPDFR